MPKQDKSDKIERIFLTFPGGAGFLGRQPSNTVQTHGSGIAITQDR